ncbi:DMT family transporter [Alicyclobacillus acidocaldarius]|uniref:DMT family transporter n=1 Tax=Alicyclobacillus acidocaldarius TaxID=405212 RepID=UPI001FE1E30D|nr:DMT family transporter [Alicyclobacillus acidocaldarius]
MAVSGAVAVVRRMRSMAQGNRFRRFRGIGLALLGSILWGVSGTAAQVLFQADHVNPAWLVAVRMVVAGVLLLAACCFKEGVQAFAPWRAPHSAVRTAVFGLAGLLGVQYTYFAAIHAGNAATATVLQYMAPIVIVGYASARSRRAPTALQIICVGLALLGCLLLVTNGHIERLAVSGACVAWGLLSAVAVAIYSIFPVPLIAAFGPLSITAWGMLVGGAAVGLATAPYLPVPHLSAEAWCLVAFVVVFGTLIPFYLYLASLRDITPADASLVASGEPLAATALAVTVLHQPLTWAALLGMGCVLLTVTLLARAKS